ncbi:CEMIP [Mytilus edulis]|uniref:CEMIP n=1 Tax=Mytilus edulis TaxID=6550 RepID=A0A8S3QCR1_MYTED|nr:CEMIP [Mytilus edulis]
MELLKFLFYFILIAACAAKCPDSDANLLKWSDHAGTWSVSPPAENDNLTITQPILLDEQPPTLYSIVITATGKLVWDPNTEVHLKVHWVQVDGELHIGSEDCPFLSNTHITFLGPLKFTHYGEIYKNVDMRGEVGLLTRNILFDTEDAEGSTTYGGNLKVEDNVCYMTKGHGYFLEDGGEKRTGRGYWFTYPRIPTGPSADKGYMLKDEARHTVITEFDNNVAHSNKKHGFFLDNEFHPDGSATGYNRYRPKEDPIMHLKYKNSTDKPSIINRMTGYKNSPRNAWIRGGMIKVVQASMKNFNPRNAIALRRGPIYVTDVFFDDFADNEYYQMGAIGWDKLQKQSPFHSITNAQFGFSDLAIQYSSENVLTMTRDDDYESARVDADSSEDANFLVITGDSYSYSMFFEEEVPKNINIKMVGLSKYLALFLADVNDFEPGEFGQCVGEGEMCKRVMIKIEKGDLTESDCLSAVHEKFNLSSDSDVNWGAGSTRG